MNASRFDAIVRARAHERAQNKIAVFRSAIRAAIRELGIDTPSSYYDGWLPHDIKEDLRLVLDNVSSGMYWKPGVPTREAPLKDAEWPRSIWDKEIDAVEKELLATMDEMQKALIAPTPSNEGPQPTKSA